MAVASASPQARPAQRTLIPFRKGTRQHFDKAGEITYSSGVTGTPLRLPQFGFLAGLLLRVRGTMTLSAAGALTADGPWALVRRLRVALNTGIEIVSLTGYGAFLLNFLIKEEFAANSSTQALVFAAPVAAGANTWAFMLYLPIAANDGQNFEVGLINLQTEELVANVEIDWGAPLDASTLATGFVGAGDVFMLWYEVPDPRRVQFPPLNIVHRLMEDRISINGVGDVRYVILRQGTIQQLVHTVRLNGARAAAADVVALRLELNRADRVYRYETAPQLWHQAMRYGQDLPTGVYVWDFWHSQMDVAQGDGRDFVDTEAVAQIDSVVEIASGATLGSNNNFLDTIRRHTLVLRP